MTSNRAQDRAKKSLFLLSSIGPEAYTKIKSKFKPGKIANQDFDQIVAAARSVYKQQLTVIGRRNHFMVRSRKSTESVSQYALALRELCGACEYTDAVPIKEQPRDVFVEELNLPNFQSRLMLKDNTLTFNDAYKEAVADEMAPKCSAQLNLTRHGGKWSPSSHHKPG